MKAAKACQYRIAVWVLEDGIRGKQEGASEDWMNTHGNALRAMAGNTLNMRIYGEKMGIACEDEDSGPMTLNVGKVMVEDGQIVFCCDSRIPVSLTVESIIEKVQAKMEGTGFTYATRSTEGPLYVSKDSELVKTLMGAYSKVTGDYETQPQSSGGATYSRAIANCVAFGCLLPEQEDTMHQANEALELVHLKTWLEIMVEAIYQLAK